MVDLRTIQNVKTLQNVGWDRPDTGIPDALQQKIDGAVNTGFKKVWHGVLQVAASGFGKGVLIAAGVLVAGTMLFMGMSAEAGLIQDAVTKVPITADTAIKGGIGWALKTLAFNPLGWLYLAAGGAMGAVADTKKHQNHISEEIAKQQAKDFERQRESGIERPISIQRAEDSRTQPRTQEHNHTHAQTRHTAPLRHEPTYVREGEVESKFPQPTNGRAAKSVANAFATGEINLEQSDPTGFAERERERRIARAIRGRAT